MTEEQAMQYTKYAAKKALEEIKSLDVSIFKIVTFLSIWFLLYYKHIDDVFQAKFCILEDKIWGKED